MRHSRTDVQMLWKRWRKTSKTRATLLKLRSPKLTTYFYKYYVLLGKPGRILALIPWSLKVGATEEKERSIQTASKLTAAVTINRLRSANRLSSTELKSEFRLKLILCDTLARFLWYYGGIWYTNILC